jgi:hypothetical protein
MSEKTVTTDWQKRKINTLRQYTGNEDMIIKLFVIKTNYNLIYYRSFMS